MHYKKILLAVSLALTLNGCIGDASDPFGEPVDETEFLEENAQKEGVTVTQSGLQYRVLEESDGDRPFNGAVVFMEYEGRLINDEVFVRTSQLDYFEINDEIISGIQEGAQLMEVGSTYELVLPPELGYGDEPPAGSPIRPGSVLIFDITLDSFLQDPNEFLSENAELEDIQVTDSGLQYRVIEEGSGPSPNDESSVHVNYSGTFTNGYEFDASQSGGANFSLAQDTQNSVIPGLSEGIQLMEEGATYEFFIPADIGYGDNPPESIPEGAVLVFEVELLAVSS